MLGGANEKESKEGTAQGQAVQGWERPLPQQELAELLENRNPCDGGGRASTVVRALRASRVLAVASRDEGHLGPGGCAGTKDVPGMEKPFHVRQAPETMERKAGRGHRKDQNGQGVERCARTEIQNQL